MTDRQYHVDGDLVPASEATVHVSDRGYKYGDAAFETVRVYGGTLFRWDAHLDRLADTCEILSLDHGLSRDELRERVETVLDANEFSDASVRLSISRGSDDGGIVPESETDPTVVITCRPLPRGGRAGESTWDGPATLQTVKTRRPPDRALPSKAKTHNYLNGVLAGLELQVTGADEALILDMDGYVAEGTTSNCFFVDDRALHTPSLEGPVLAGVTRDVVLDLAQSEGLPVRTGRYTPDDFRSADEVFVTSSTREIRPVGTVDGIEIDGGPVTPLLSRLYDALVERECYAGRSAASGSPAGSDGTEHDGNAEKSDHGDPTESDDGDGSR
jgi:branched-chain amino acid aminotransferase